MVLIGLPLLEEERAGYNTSDAQHQESTWYEYILAPENGLGCQVDESISLPVSRVIVICNDYGVLTCIEILLDAPPHLLEIGQT